MGTRLLAALLAGALLAAGCSSEAETEAGADPAPAPEGAASGWRKLPDAPLSPRVDAVLVGVDERVLVVGGWEFTCPPTADCSPPTDPLLADGAVYDATTDSWRPATPPPFGLRRQAYASVALDGTAYLLTGCETGPACDALPRLLSYRPADDRWTDHGPVPGPERNLRITSLDRTLLVYTDATALGRVPDLVFDPALSTWTELPADPLPAVYDRFVVPVGDQLVLAGSPSAAPGSGGGPPAKLAARLDLATGEWTALPDAPGPGFQLMATDRGPLLNGHVGDRSGWLLDPATWTWTALPELPGEGGDVGGVLDRDRAAYDLANTVGGWSAPVRVYGSAAGEYVTIPRAPGRDDVYGESSTALGRDLVVHGGQRWTDSRRTDDGELVGDAWLWTAPAG